MTGVYNVVVFMMTAHDLVKTYGYFVMMCRMYDEKA